MNTVLQQELIRFNKLIKLITSSLLQLKKALKGQAVLTNELDKVYISLFDNKIPEMWAAISYPSLKPLGAYISDLV